MSRILLIFSLMISFSAFAKKHPKRFLTSQGSYDPSMLQKILTIEDSRNDRDHYLPIALKYPSRNVVKAAILAVARLGDPSSLGELSEWMNRKDKELGQLAAFAIGQIGGDIGYRLLTQHLQLHKDPEMQKAILLAIGQIG